MITDINNLTKEEIDKFTNDDYRNVSDEEKIKIASKLFQLETDAIIAEVKAKNHGISKLDLNRLVYEKLHEEKAPF